MNHEPLMISFDAEKRQSILWMDKGYELYSGLPKAFLNELCLHSGSTYEGRIQSFRYMTHTRQKTPVMISEITGSIYFPTLSPESADCVWMHYNDILEIRQRSLNCTVVLFKNGNKIDMDLNCRIIRNQMKRCAAYLNSLDQGENEEPWQWMNGWRNHCHVTEERD